MRGDVARGISAGKNRIKRLTAGLEPFVEHLGLEQRSREVRKGESRIRFARKEPPADCRQYGRFIPDRVGSRNLPPLETGGRDVLYVQRTGQIRPIGE
jgi:hypothetical protein